jgi:hypothetical protein
MQQHHNLKTIPCWVCKSPTRCGVEAVRVICPDCVQSGATFGRKPILPPKPEEAQTDLFTAMLVAATH